MQVEKTPTGIKLWKLVSVLALSHNRGIYRKDNVWIK